MPKRNRYEQQWNSVRLLPVREEPALVLSYLSCRDIESVAATCADASLVCDDNAVVRRIAEDRLKRLARPLSICLNLRTLDKCDRLDAAIGAWSVLSVVERETPLPLPVSAFDEIPDGVRFVGEVSVLYNAEHGIMIEIQSYVRFVNWTRRSLSYEPLSANEYDFGEDGEFCCDWECYERFFRKNARSISEAFFRRLLPRGWHISCVDSMLVIRYANSGRWLQLTNAGFRTATRVHENAFLSGRTPETHAVIACHHVTTDAAGAHRAYQLPTNTKGPWSDDDDPPLRGMTTEVRCAPRTIMCN
jgi:hypothetical protein